MFRAYKLLSETSLMASLSVLVSYVIPIIGRSLLQRPHGSLLSYVLKGIIMRWGRLYLVWCKTGYEMTCNLWDWYMAKRLTFSKRFFLLPVVDTAESSFLGEAVSPYGQDPFPSTYLSELLVIYPFPPLDAANILGILFLAAGGGVL